MHPTPVKEAAQACGIEVAQPEKIKGNEEFLTELRDLKPDLIVVAAYGKILPAELLAIPARGCINIHASLLPRFRGAAPIQRSIIKGDEVTGVTLMYMEEGLDTGDMIAKASTEIAVKMPMSSQTSFPLWAQSCCADIFRRFWPARLRGKAG